MSNVRVRIAPSPTGRLHIGTARTALFNWLFAKKTGGAFILRIEDTDRERSTKAFEADIFSGLAWLELQHDELYRQSERIDTYTRYLQQMLDAGTAFFCNHSVEELSKEATEQRVAKEPPRHICSQRNERRTAGIIRFKNNATDAVIVNDIIRGEVIYNPQLLGDFSLAKNSKEPLYNFAAVIDDFELKISHVIRGEDHLSNTPKQILISNNLGIPIPQWAHLPLLLGQDRSKLSKRHGALSLLEYRDMGYLPNAMINFIALLGWHPKDEVGEILDPQTLIKEFSLERIQKGGAIVTQEKLDWLNREYLKMLSDAVYIQTAKQFIGDDNMKSTLPDETLENALRYIRPRIVRLDEVQTQLHTIFVLPPYDKTLLLWKGKITENSARDIIDSLINILSGIKPSEFTLSSVESNITPLLQKNGKGSVLWPLRAALSGKEASLGPYELAHILGKSEVLRRLERARQIFSA